MSVGITKAYHNQWVKDRSTIDRIALSDRVVRTIQKLFEKILHRSFKGGVA